MRPTQPKDLADLALSLISIEPIVSLVSPSSDTEKVAAKWYDHTLRYCLSLHPWNFAKGRFSCPRVGTPAFGYSDEYRLPSDYIRLNIVGIDATDFIDNFKDQYSIEGGNILTNFGNNPLPIQYTKYEERVGLFSPWFIDVMKYAYAMNMSPELNRTTTEIQLLEQQFQLALESAKQFEGQESPPSVITTSRYKQGIQ